jgi:pyrimidine-nucleoside phosphorylase
MTDVARAEELARTMVGIGNSLDRPTVALLTDMNQPLGLAVGNSLEMIECIETMKGNAPEDLLEITIELGARMVLLARIRDSLDEAKKSMREAILNGKALEKFKQFVEQQGGNPGIVDDYTLFDVSPGKAYFTADRAGTVTHIETLQVGVASMILGAGRERIEDPVDFGVGFIFKKNLGDTVEKGEPICEVYYRKDDELQRALDILGRAISITDEKIKPPELVKSIIDR